MAACCVLPWDAKRTWWAGSHSGNSCSQGNLMYQVWCKNKFILSEQNLYSHLINQENTTKPLVLVLVLRTVNESTWWSEMFYLILNYVSVYCLLHSCFVSIDLTVTRGTLVRKFVQKCQYYNALLDQSIPLVPVRSIVSLLTEQLWPTYVQHLWKM